MRALIVSDVVLTGASFTHRKTGLLGWLSVTVNGCLAIDGIALRITKGQRYTLAFPERRDQAGRSHAVVRPLDEETRHAIERQVLRALDLAPRDAP